MKNKEKILKAAVNVFLWDTVEFKVENIKLKKWPFIFINSTVHKQARSLSIYHCATYKRISKYIKGKRNSRERGGKHSILIKNCYLVFYSLWK